MRLVDEQGEGKEVGVGRPGWAQLPPWGFVSSRKEGPPARENQLLPTLVSTGEGG